MKHAHDITLILPEHLSLDEFQQIINTSLKTANDSYTKYMWDHENNKEVEVDIDGNNCTLETVASGGDKLLMEFEHNEKEK